MLHTVLALTIICVGQVVVDTGKRASDNSMQAIAAGSVLIWKFVFLL